MSLSVVLPREAQDEMDEAYGRMVLREARQFALSLPETTEEPHFQMASFRVRGRVFATVPPDGAHLRVFMDEHETRAVVEADPQAFAELWWGKRLAGVRVNLADAEAVCELLEDAWRRRAPKRAVAAFKDRAGLP
jgi:hypothetical protein